MIIAGCARNVKTAVNQLAIGKNCPVGKLITVYCMDSVGVIGVEIIKFNDVTVTADTNKQAANIQL